MGEGTGPGSSRPGTGASGAHGAESVVGRWAKSGTGGCEKQYPDVVEFFEGTFLGARGPGQGFLLWDAGIYKRLTPDRIRIQIATDELVTYQCSVSADRLSVLDPHGCRLEYQRVRTAPEDEATDETEEPT